MRIAIAALVSVVSFGPAFAASCVGPAGSAYGNIVLKNGCPYTARVYYCGRDEDAFLSEPVRPGGAFVTAIPEGQYLSWNVCDADEYDNNLCHFSECN